MQAFPHHYHVEASAEEGRSHVAIGSAGLTSIETDTPIEFGGPGNRWSPETLLAAAIASCLVLTFRGIARKSRLTWTDIKCRVIATLDRRDQVTQFTEYVAEVSLRVPEGTDIALARHVVERAEATCLIARSLTARGRLEVVVEAVAVQSPAPVAVGG